MFNIDPFRANQRDTVLGQKVCANLTIEDAERINEIQSYENNVNEYLNSVLFS